jgi:predicted DNA-binding transcriptional regulator AlpA
MTSQDRLLTYPDLRQRKGIPYTRQHISRLEKDRKFPARVQCGAGRVAWWESEIDEHLRSLARGPLPLHRNGR